MTAATPEPKIASNRTENDTVPPREAALIVNAKARRGEAWFAEAKTRLQNAGITLRQAEELENPKELPDKVKAALHSGVKLIILGGGDGTFRGVAGLLAQSEAALGVLPLGTVNDFARNLGIEANVEAACKAIASGRVEPIHVGQANDEAFLITASLGLSALSQTTLSPRLKKAFGPFGYLIASVLALRNLREVKVRVRSEGVDETYPILQAGVINSHRWMGGTVDIPGVKLENGKLAFYAVPPQSGWSFLRMVRSLRDGKFFHTPGLRAFTTRDVHIEVLQSRRTQPLVLDGDLQGQMPVRFCQSPHALRVCVPAAYQPPV